MSDTERALAEAVNDAIREQQRQNFQEALDRFMDAAVKVLADMQPPPTRVQRFRRWVMGK